MITFLPSTALSNARMPGASIPSSLVKIKVIIYTNALLGESQRVAASDMLELLAEKIVSTQASIRAWKRSIREVEID